MDCQEKVELSGQWEVFFSPSLPLDSHGALLLYHEQSAAAQLIHELKYNFIEEALHPFESFFDSWKQSVSASLHRTRPGSMESCEIIIPVPLHRRRFAERGFNQAELIARMVGKKLNLQISNSLQRTRFTRPQVGLSHEEREQNVKSAFALNGVLLAKNILLVDDVYTTGSTMQECARILKQAGAQSVVGFTLARAV